MILDDFKLDGKVAIVTGARTGLGQGMAIGLAEAGADITTVCAAADDETIKSAINEGRARNIIVVIDTLNTPSSRWKEIDKLKPDYICIHVGIDHMSRPAIQDRFLEDSAVDACGPETSVKLTL